MTEIRGADRQIGGAKQKMYRVEAIQAEMSSAVRLLGGDGPAKESNNAAARLTRLPVTVIERLRWRKIKRIPADIADTIREAVERYNEESLRRAQHELTVARAKNAALLAYLENSDPDFYRPEIARLRGEDSGHRRPHDYEGAA